MPVRAHPASEIISRADIAKAIRRWKTPIKANAREAVVWAEACVTSVLTHPLQFARAKKFSFPPDLLIQCPLWPHRTWSAFAPNRAIAVAYLHPHRAPIRNDLCNIGAALHSDRLPCRAPKRS